ncbi:MAG TPA: aminotransferase class III-fold pyridoxal phosphate-dependent enzyme [Kofleriaceae bacterium]|nr:aminotransferase class III-fold pyridoxal phosphate-dependent enzyme [Kofleriaceae bacterium]
MVNQESLFVSPAELPALRLVTEPDAADAAGREAFRRLLKPRLMEMLAAIKLDHVYHRGEGDSLFYYGPRGEEIEVLDLLGGFGASLFGHNHPELVAALRKALDDKRPFNAQASARSRAGLLAQRLSDLVGKVTGRSYVATLASSGTEAVEAAMKHAELEAWERKQAAIRRALEVIARIRAGLRDGKLAFAAEQRAQAAERLGLAPGGEGVDFDAIAAALEARTKQAFERPAITLAIAGAFHGKTAGALKLTHNAEYRYAWARWGSAAFLPRGDVSELHARLAQAKVEYLELVITLDRVELSTRAFHNIAACIVEPIQGEGGINEVSAEYLGELRKAADDGGFPLIIDEIQSGLGRTGELLASAPSGVRGDYYLFSKALGGGLTKVSALLVDRARYLKDFGYLHTSTFADDDLSASVALAALDLIERDDGALARRCRDKGEYLLGRLRALQARYPGQLRDVRGRGLLVGIELQPQLRSPSPFIRVMSEQRLLSFFVAGYLLNEARIRVLPALSSHSTIRIEPSADISLAALDRACDALEQVLIALRDNDAVALSGFAVRHRPAVTEVRDVREPVDYANAGFGGKQPRPADAEPIAFIVHYMLPEDLGVFDPAFTRFSPEECADFIDRTRGLIKPFIGDRRIVRSITGASVDLSIIGVPFSAKQAVTAMRNRDADWALRAVKDAVTFARDLGCTNVGLGGFTSIVSNSCTSLAVDHIAITSGNSLTVAGAIDALLAAASRMTVRKRKLGVVGATGNIGAMLAEVCADAVDELVLIGRPGALGRLERLAQRVKIPCQVTTDMAALVDCPLIISASSSPHPIILPEHIGKEPVVLCDVAVPGDVDPRVVRERPEALVLRGGRFRLPFDQDVGRYRIARSNPHGVTFACCAETIVLGFEKNQAHFSYGSLTADKIRLIRDQAKKHGLTMVECTVPTLETA